MEKRDEVESGLTITPIWPLILTMRTNKPYPKSARQSPVILYIGKMLASVIIAVSMIGCQKNYDQQLKLSEIETQNRLIVELKKRNVDYKVSDDNGVWFAEEDKKSVYAMLNQLILEKPKKEITVSCELDNKSP